MALYKCCIIIIINRHFVFNILRIKKFLYRLVAFQDQVCDVIERANTAPQLLS